MANKLQSFFAKNKKFILYLFIEVFFVLIVLMIDLLTKKYIYGKIKVTGEDIILIPNVLRFTAVENTGASFGMMKNSTKFLSYVSLFSVILLFAFIVFTIKDRNPLLRTALVLITAGGFGNMIDRFKYEYVRDFVYFELINFPVFNFADSALTIGCILAIIWVIVYFSKKIKDDKNKKHLDDNDSDVDNKNF
ncbi:MAG TPA: signal peptidase II [Clostridiales bacterium]|nr:signal peptidase II [Clostridiales bacterium]